MSAAAACAAAAGGLAVVALADLVSGRFRRTGGARVLASVHRAASARLRSTARQPGSARRRRSVGVAAWARRFAEVADGRVHGIAPPGNLSRNVLAAGAPGGLAARDWLALKCGAAIGGAAIAIIVASAAPGRLAVVLTAAAPAAAFVLPDFWLARRARTRLEAASSELPGMLDLLRVTVEAGQSPIASIGSVGARFSGPLAAEWRAAAAQVALGLSHDEALERMAARVPTAEVRELADTLRGARRRGLPLAAALTAQAIAARHARRRQIRERAARAGPKIQLVVALVLAPSVLLTMAAVLITELSQPGLGISY